MDYHKISSSADMGIALKGDLSEKVHHWLMIMNGTGYGSAETDKYKKIGYAVWFTPVKGLILEGYVDYEKQQIPWSEAFYLYDHCLQSMPTQADYIFLLPLKYIFYSFP